jgi:hypothetical protein
MSGGLLALLLLAPPAVSESPARLRWSAPAECPVQDQVAEEIEALAGMALSDVEAISIEARIEAIDGGGYALSLRIETDTGAQARTLESPDCGELAGVAATLVAVAIEAAVPEPEPTPEPASPREPEPEPEPGPEPEPEPSPDVETGWRGFAGVSIGPGLGALPGAAAVGSLAVGARGQWVLVEADGNVWFPRSTRLADASGTLLLWSLGARACGLPSVGPVTFPLCVGAEAGQLQGSASGVANARRAALPWVAATTRAGVRVPLTGRLSLRADLGVLIPVLRPGFSIDGVGVLHRATPAAGTAGLGLEVHFP